MKTQQQLAALHRMLGVLFVITLLIGIPPLAIYGWAQWTGSLPAEEVWATRGGNHGPWWGQWQEAFILFPILAMALLPFTTLWMGAAASLSLNEKRGVNFAKGVGLALLQWIWAYALLMITFWTVD